MKRSWGVLGPIIAILLDQEQQLPSADEPLAGMTTEFIDEPHRPPVEELRVKSNHILPSSLFTINDTDCPITQ